MNFNNSSILAIFKKLWFFSANVPNETYSSAKRIWQVGAIYSTYRILISIFLILNSYVLESQLSISWIEKATLNFYLLIALLLLFFLYFYKKWISHILNIGFITDVIILSILLYTHTIAESQIVLLFIVVVAASFILVRLSGAIIITLIAILSLIFQQVFSVTLHQYSLLTLTDTLLLSICFIAVGFLSWSVSQRLAIAEAQANNHEEEIKRLHAINQQVINHMVNGVIVIGRSHRLLIINDTAKQLLRLDYNDNPANRINLETLFEIERNINQKYPSLYEWSKQKNNQDSFELTLPASDSARTDKLRINKKSLPAYGQLLIIEDVSREESYAQKLKLASLGQLTASIAHEIRNPLTAISQASEILMETQNCDEGSQELHHMIYKQTKRVNRIIESIVRLSRQEPPNQVPINLKDWLPMFLNNHFENRIISVAFHGSSQIIFDPNHLEQIFVNLVNNALRHTQQIANEPDVQIIVHDNEDNHDEIFIDILDNGDGVNPEDLTNLFNPFFTKSVGGTGLGLYLSQAFSKANYAKLRYLPNEQKTCFRLICFSATSL